MRKNVSKSGSKENEALVVKKLSISEDSDLITIRKCGREMAVAMGYTRSEQTLIVTALSEIGRNILEYAGEGEITIEPKKRKRKKCIFITAVDSGPGIEDIENALKEGFTTGKGMGMGLPGAKRIMDEFAIESEMGAGTTVKMCRYLDH